MVAATVDDDDVNSLRGAVRRLQPPGAERIHFVHESDGRRRSLLKEFARLGIRTVVFDAGRLDDRAARVWCLERIVELAARANTSRIVIETDESIVQADNRTLYRAVAGLGSREQIRYEHQRAASEPLLWVPDAVAWAHGPAVAACIGHWSNRLSREWCGTPTESAKLGSPTVRKATEFTSRRYCNVLLQGNTDYPPQVKVLRSPELRGRCR